MGTRGLQTGAVVGFAVALAGCSVGGGGGIGAPDLPFHTPGTVVGASGNDLWFWAPNAQFDTALTEDSYRDTLWHYGGGWTEVTVPAAIDSASGTMGFAKAVSAGDGSVFLGAAKADGSGVVMLRVGASGDVEDDRSADFPAFLGPMGSFQMRGVGGAVFVALADSQGLLDWYRYDGSAFVPFVGAGDLAYVASDGPDHAWFTVTTRPDGYPATYELAEYKDGAWTTVGPASSTGSFLLPAADGSAWMAPSVFTEHVVSHGTGASWSQIQVTGYTDAVTDGSATLSPLAWAVAESGDLAVLSRLQEPQQSGMDWSEQAWVSGTIGVDGAYGDQRVIVPTERCDPTCYNGLSFVDGLGPARLDDGSVALDKPGESEVGPTYPDWTLVVWRP